MENIEWKKGEYCISTDRDKIDLDAVYNFLSQSYWAAGRPRKVVEKSISHSLCFAIYKSAKLVGFARVISDYSTFGYLADVFVLEEERGKGLSKWLMESIISHPQLQGLRRFTLATRDAHGLYEKFGFKLFAKPERWMERE